MKTFIPVYGSLMTIDHDNDDVKKVANNVSTCIDYVYIVPEDGKILNKEVHKGDIILTMYGIVDENDNDIKSKEDKLIILDKDSTLAKYITERAEMREKIRIAKEAKKANNNNDCDCYDKIDSAQEVFNNVAI